MDYRACCQEEGAVTHLKSLDRTPTRDVICTTELPLSQSYTCTITDREPTVRAKDGAAPGICPLAGEDWQTNGPIGSNTNPRTEIQH